MGNNEHIIFQDIPVRGRLHDYHSAVLTTFSVDLVNIDSKILNTLRHKKICSLSIFADNAQLDNAYSFVSPQSVPHLGCGYTITGIRVPGAFHPKINFFAGYNSALCLIGSGNLTAGGHGKNHELFTGFMADDDNPLCLPLIKEIWAYLCDITAHAGEFEQQRILKEIPQNCSLLKNSDGYTPHQVTELTDGLQAALLYNDGRSGIFSQLKEIVPFPDVRKVTVVSPFFDEDGRTLDIIQKECPAAGINVLIQEDSDRLPFKIVNDNIRFFNFNKTVRGKKNFKNFQRTMHLKMFLFETDSMKYCITGSANATEAGLGNPATPGTNYEMCVLYASSGIDFLKELELNYSEKDRIALTAKTTSAKAVSPRQSLPFRIREASVRAEKLIVDINNPAALSDYTLVLDVGSDIIQVKNYDITDGRICASVVPSEKSFRCYIANSDGEPASNVMFVKNINALHRTNPSKSARELNSIISRIQIDGFCGLDVASMLGNVLGNIIDEQATASDRFKSKETEKIKPEKLPEIKYNPELNNPEYDYTFSVFQNRAFGSRMIECIEDRLRKKLINDTEQQIDEEEEARPESSLERHEVAQSNLLKKNDLKEYPKQMRSLWRLYEKYLSQREKTPAEIITENFSEDISFFTLTLFSTLEISYLNRHKYEFKKIPSLEESVIKKELFHTFDDIMTSDGLKNMTRFAQLIVKLSDEYGFVSENMPKEALWAIKYLLIFKCLLGRMFPCSPVKDAKEKDLDNIIKIFIRHFGLPDEGVLENEIRHVADNYSHLFEFWHIRKALDTFR